ncbi:hypothetical protein TNIN_300661 [Trichonephila inaurata madagascariensis]|uniref:Uncharacterized protein n=1 Tax=Trichonephila inaurata madagascariensis TaxID=2747483 RepID=A0A8X6WQH6_9ARAC|nr:hypothetical protein TNIN_300661 [Trichonephila inaurata madagascariensis]
MNSLTTLLNHNCLHSNKKHFHHDLCQETVYKMNHFSQQKLTGTDERSLQYPVSEKMFPENDRVWDIRPHTGEKSIQNDVCGENFLIQAFSVTTCLPILGRKLTNSIYVGKRFLKNLTLMCI